MHLPATDLLQRTTTADRSKKLPSQSRKGQARHPKRSNSQPHSRNITMPFFIRLEDAAKSLSTTKEDLVELERHHWIEFTHFDNSEVTYLKGTSSTVQNSYCRLGTGLAYRQNRFPE